MAAVLNPDSAGRRRSFYDRINVGNCAPLWEVIRLYLRSRRPLVHRICGNGSRYGPGSGRRAT
jgi:hypothetical protein